VSKPAKGGQEAGKFGLPRYKIGVNSISAGTLGDINNKLILKVL